MPSQPFAQRVAVVPFVGDYPRGLLSRAPRTMSSFYPDRLERPLFPEEDRGRPNSLSFLEEGRRARGPELPACPYFIQTEAKDGCVERTLAIRNNTTSAGKS